MGQKSQVYIRWKDGNGNSHLIASYFQWCYGQYLVSRARHTIEIMLRNKDLDVGYFFRWKKDGIRKLLEVNFDTHDISDSYDITQWYSEYGITDSFNKYVFTGVDNNDGKLFIDIKPDWTISYGFVNQCCDSNSVMDAEKYMDFEAQDCVYDDWRNTDYVDSKTCQNNIKFLRENAVLMTPEDITEFVECEYLK